MRALPIGASRAYIVPTLSVRIIGLACPVCQTSSSGSRVTMGWLEAGRFDYEMLLECGDITQCYGNCSQDELDPRTQARSKSSLASRPCDRS